jgi:hypothetical protein
MQAAYQLNKCHMDNLTIARPQVEIDADVQALVEQQAEQCTIVHCRYYTGEPAGVRIWPTTYLVEDSGKRCSLVKAFNISIMPEWTFHFIENDYIRFTLVFEGLAQDCREFYVLEDIPQPYAFYSKMIKKNSSGVYTAEVIVR